MIGWKLLALGFPLGRRLHLPSDRLGHQISTMLMEDSEARSRLINGIYLPDDPDDITGRLGHAFELTLKADEVEKRLRSSGHVYEPSEDYNSWLRRLQEESLISREEKTLMEESYKTVYSLVMVDDFPAGKRAVK